MLTRNKKFKRSMQTYKTQFSIQNLNGLKSLIQGSDYVNRFLYLGHGSDGSGKSI